jgi:anti-sigma regulatory factor (Ser/Thr protein kinase)
MSRLCLNLNSVSTNLETLSLFVKENARRAGLDEVQVNRIVLVVEEAALNIIHHAYAGEGGELEFCCAPLQGGLEIRLVDAGPPFNPLQAPALEVDTNIASHRIGGMGIHLIRGLSDALDYRREGERNVLTLRFLHKSGEGP